MILLDTHALVWWRDGSGKLSNNAQAAIAKEAKSGTISISAFSFWEIALLVEHHRLTLPSDLQTWMAEVETINRMRFILSIIKLPSRPFSSPPACTRIRQTASWSRLQCCSIFPS